LWYILPDGICYQAHLLQESEKSIDLFNVLIGPILGLEEKHPNQQPKPIAKRKLNIHGSQRPLPLKNSPLELLILNPYFPNHGLFRTMILFI